MPRTRSNPGLLVTLKHDARVSLHRQIELSIRNAIRAGRLPRGSALPPSRALAADLGVSRGIVVEAYQQLTAEGYLVSSAGGYTRVAVGPAPPVTELRLARDPKPPIDLSYGRADVSSFPRAAWLRAIRHALSDAPNDVFGYLVTRGEFDRHLRRMRAVYRHRRDALLAALQDRLPQLEPADVSAGLHLVAWLPPHLEESAVVSAARRAGVGVDAVGPYRITNPGQDGLIFGYATVSEQAIAEGIDRLATVISNPGAC